MKTMLAISMLATAAAPAAFGAPAVPKGKIDTGRAIELSVVVDGMPDEVFDLWASPAGIRKFFAPAARIDPVVGGEYTMIFAPDIDPDGSTQGTKGSHVLAWERPHRLSFEWATFVTTNVPSIPHPPVVTPEERYGRPYPVWVDLVFDPAPTPGKTTVRLWCRGFERGEKWDKAVRYFNTNWGLVLGRLASSRVADTAAAEKPAPAR